MADPHAQDQDDRRLDLAVHRKPEPPRTLEEWEVWYDACVQSNNRQWLPLSWSVRWAEDGGIWGASWLPSAEDHPFTGRWFCWRCIAEATNRGTPGAYTHDDASDAICWAVGTAAEAQPSSDGDADACEGVEGVPADFRDTWPPSWTDHEAADEQQVQAPSPVADTGNLFWPPPGWATGIRSTPVRKRKV